MVVSGPQALPDFSFFTACTTSSKVKGTSRMYSSFERDAVARLSIFLSSCWRPSSKDSRDLERLLKWFAQALTKSSLADRIWSRPVKSHALRVWHTQLVPFTRSHANQDYFHAFLFMPAWNRDIASSFTNIRDRRIKMPRALGHYLLYNSSSTGRWGPTSVTVHALLISRAPDRVWLALFPEQGTKLHSQHTYHTVFHII